MPQFEIVGVSDIVDSKARVPFIIVRQRLPQCEEKFILQARDEINFKVRIIFML